MMKTLGIFGMGGFAREVADIAWELGFRVIHIAPSEAERDAWHFGGDIMLESEGVQRHDMVFAIGIGENGVRARIAQRYEALDFISLIHPSASFGRGQRERVAAAKGVIVCAGVRLTNNIEVGDFSIFNLNATIGHDTVLGRFANVAPGANISGNVLVGERVWIGTGAAINQGRGDAMLAIGAGTVIGSGSVVVKDCEPDAVYAGVPAKRIK